LPTASGKSLCSHLPALLEESSLTVVVVPTVSLALDQEQAIGLNATAYRSGADGNASTIRDSIRRQDQRIVFASPEAILSGLSGVLKQATEDGYLKHLVIDEAHIVDTWGDEFRPAFQELAGFRQMLLDLAPSPFQTLLLSATITRASEDTLRRLFGDPGPFETCAAVQLRPEPSYVLNQNKSDEERTDAVLDAIHHLPRPIILYVSKREHVRTWHQRLLDAGYGRVAHMSGNTSSSKREEVIRQWRNRESDIVVATSAFGMGVDQQDVRTVIHACLPETVDRYYQEVGRAGRDGNASVAYLCTAPRDTEIAENLAAKCYIGVEKGIERWSRMFGSADHIGNLFNVSLKETYDPTMSSRENILWNQRTLLLMQRAGFIDLLGPPFPRHVAEIEGTDTQSQDPSTPSAEDTASGESAASANSTDPNFDSRGAEDIYEHLRHHRLVHIKTHKHLQQDKWDNEFEAVRQEAKSYVECSKELMQRILDQEVCISRVLARAYARNETSVARTCNGCPYCRKHDRRRRDTSMPVPPWPWSSPTSPPDLDVLGDLHAYIFYPKPEKTRDKIRFINLLNGLVKRGTRHIVASSSIIDEMNIRDGQQVYTSNVFSPFHLPDIPTLHVVEQGAQVSLAAKQAKGPSVCVHILPESAADPQDPQRNLRRMLKGNVIPLGEALSRLRI
jgi:superfamily II DNA/RNA helicase